KVTRLGARARQQGEQRALVIAHDDRHRETERILRIEGCEVEASEREAEPVHSPGGNQCTGTRDVPKAEGEDAASGVPRCMVAHHLPPCDAFRIPGARLIVLSPSTTRTGS